MNKNFSWSSKAIILIAVFLFSTFFSFNLWNKNRINIDAPSYYAYLPSLFIYHDLSLEYVKKDRSFFKDKIWFNVTPEGKPVIKSAIGMSVCWVPFFFIGHLAAFVSGAAPDGYSLPYQNALSIGVICYLLIGLHFLRKALLKYFTQGVVALTLMAIALGTNLFYYSTFEGLMNHSVSFSLLCICIYFFFEWIEKGDKKNLFVFSFVFGLVLLIRPLSIALLIYFLIGGVLMKGGLKNFSKFLNIQIIPLLISCGIIAALFFPQFFYWRWATGQWYFDTYIDEHFYFDRPEVLGFLFSFRKGWLVYTPVMWFAVIGCWFIFKIRRPLFFATIISVAFTVYLFSSWWAWSYGICFGMRPMIDSYSFLSFPLAASFSFFSSQKKIATYLFGLILVLLIELNLFQTWQYTKGLIHFDWMTNESYAIGLFQTQASPEWYDSLKPYDWERRKKGLSQIDYSKKYFDGIKSGSVVYLRGSNLKFLETNTSKNYFITSSSDDVTENSFFQLIRLNGDTIALRSANQKFLSIKYVRNGVVRADADSLKISEIFIIHQIKEGDNKISLQALNKKYLTINPEWDNVFCAFSDTLNFNSTFRFFSYSDTFH